MQRILIRYLDFIIYWIVVVLPFSIAVAPAPMNVFMALLIVAYLVKKILKRERPFSKTAINIPLLFLFVITCLSVINSINYRDSFKGGILRLLQYIFIFFIVTEELKDRRHIKKIIFFMGLGAVLSSMDAVWQVLTGKDFIRGYDAIINLGMVRATASFKDANLLGIYLSAIAPLIFGLTLYYFKGKRKIIMFFISLLILIGVLLTYSRPTLLAVYIVLIFFAIIKKDKILAFALIVLTLLSPFILPKTIKIWAREVEYNLIRFLCNDDRIAVYRNTLNMIKAHPIIGVGTNTYMKNYKKYKEFPEYRNVVTSDYMYAHSNILHMAAEIGLIGLGVFMWLLFRLFRESKIIYRTLKDNYIKVVSASLTGCLIAFLVNGLTESSLFYSRLAVIFWYLIGFSLALKADRFNGK